MSDKSLSYSIHHVNYPTANPEATEEFYGKVFGLRRIDISDVRPGTTTVLMTNGRFDLHFRPVDKDKVRVDPVHFAIEVDNWDTFIAHMDELGVRYSDIEERPTDDSMFTDILDPDGHRIEIVYHHSRAW